MEIKIKILFICRLSFAMDVHYSVDKFGGIGSYLRMDLCALLCTQIQNKGEKQWKQKIYQYV